MKLFGQKFYAQIFNHKGHKARLTGWTGFTQRAQIQFPLFHRNIREVQFKIPRTVGACF